MDIYAVFRRTSHMFQETCLGKCFLELVLKNV